MRSTWLVLVLVLLLVACGGGSSPAEKFLVTCSSSGPVTMSITDAARGCATGDGALVASGTRVHASCSATRSGICFAVACFVTTATGPDAGGQAGGSCDVIVTAPTHIACACEEATR